MAAFDDLMIEIREMPIVDVYSRVRLDSPRGDLRDIVLCDEIKTELASANVPSEFFEIGNAKKMLEEAVQYLPRIKNTATYWCLTQFLPPDDGWSQFECLGDADAVLDKGKIEKVLHACEWYKPIPKASGHFAPNVSIDSLINEAHTSRMLDRLSEATAQKVYEVADLKKAVIQLFRQAKEAGALAASVNLEPQTDFEQGDRDAADRILSLVLLGQKVNREDRKALRSYVMDLVLENCREHRMPIQLLLGRRYVRAADRQISAFEPWMGAMYAELFSRHAGTKFDVILANETMAHEFAVLSRDFRNVFLSGCPSFLAFPSAMRKTIRERIEMLPMTKCCALASGAEHVGWVCAGSMLVRRELAFALGQMIDEGYLSRDTALEVARYYLLENPKRIYKIE